MDGCLHAGQHRHHIIISYFVRTARQPAVGLGQRTHVDEILQKGLVFIIGHIIRVVFFAQFLELLVGQCIQTSGRLALCKLFQLILRKGCKIILVFILERCDRQLIAVFHRMRRDIEPVALESPNCHTISSFLY